jgi:hypothetical protein
VVAVCLAAGFAARPPVLGASLDVGSQLTVAREQCEARLQTDRRNVEVWRWVSILAAVIGGLAAAGSGQQAGRSEGKAGRVWGAIAVVAGATAAASPLLPKADEYQRRLAVADRHYIVGLKVERQLPAAGASTAFRQTLVGYSLARYTECLSVAPPEEVPDLPKPGPGDVRVFAPVEKR